ncbi:iron uptake porin [Brasilonema sp. CT11]|nr:iron uptake porin [Brasilonema sp. CT11]
MSQSKLSCQILVILLSIFSSTLILETKVLAEDSLVSKQPSTSLIDSEQIDSLVGVKQQPQKSLLTTNAEQLTPSAAVIEQANQDDRFEPGLRNSLDSKSSESTTPINQVTSVYEIISKQPEQNIKSKPASGNPLDLNSSKQNNTLITQVNSVSELTDVQPTDWAFQALQSLVERYGCIEGYPNRTYRGNRAMTRYEFAAGLNNCLDRIRELITTQTTSAVSKEDLAQIERLQKDFALELKNISGRVDTLEARTATIEQQQFSTTTKLSGQVLTYLGNAWGENAGKVNNTALGYRASLNLNTSFTGKDNLAVSLQAINLRRLDTATKFPQGRLSGVTDETRFLPSSMSGDGDLRLNGLQYKFPVGDKLVVSVDAYSGDRFLTEPITPLSNPTTGAVTYFGSINPFDYPVGQQSGIGLQWKAANWLSLDLDASGETNTNDPSVGLFGGGGYGLFARPVITLGKLRLSFPFAHFYSPDFGTDTLAGSNAAKLFGAGPVVGNSYDFSFNYRITPQMSFGGSIGHIAARTLGDGTKGNADLWDYRFNLVFFDVGKKGNLAALIFGMEPRLTGTSNAALAQAIGLPPGQRSDRDVGFHIEAFYTHRLSDNITITPAIVWLTAPNHDERNPDVIVGVLRTAFQF